MHSERDKGIGIGINKTATTSMASLINKSKDTIGGKHNTLKETKGIIEDELDKYYIFSLIRNPFDRVTSLYEYRKFRTRKVKDPTSRIAFPITKEGKIESFEEGVKKVYSQIEGHAKLRKGLGQQINGISINGEIKTNYLGYFDNINEYGKQVCKIVGIKNFKLPSKNKMEKDSFKEYYNETTYEVVRSQFQDDIKLIEDIGHKIG